PARARVVIDRSGAIFVDGRPVQRGQVVDLGSMQFTVGHVPPPDGAPLGCPGDDGTTPFHRPPRPALPPPPAPVRPPAAVPFPGPGARFSWAAVAAPVVFGAVLALLFNPLMAAFAAFAPVMVGGNWLVV